ncbi:MAG TPA: ethanolamine ammonia-lyase subunit EutC [Pirellulales bacterium]|nr:ethanolamine ammonia-lyase subunit EutC [Pirellulales bacterium]
MSDELLAKPDPWRRLRELTPARIALGRAGGSLPTHEQLDFQRSHAQARDAVQEPFDPASLAAQIARLGLPTVVAHSEAVDRKTFLARPDLGRRLADESRRLLTRGAEPPDVAIIVSDGLSALAVERHAIGVLAALMSLARRDGWRLAPVTVVSHGRVAIEDEIGQVLGAQAAVILLGERPGLSSPDSLGAYLVFDPRPGRTDAERNCVSNIRPAGLPPAAAAATIHYLLGEALRRKISGVALKDERPAVERLANET